MTKSVMTIHGFLTDTQDFGRLYEYLNFYDEVKAFKVPGHNGEVDFSLFTVNDTISEVLSCYDELRAKHDTVDVVGFSMGGALASYLCAKRDVNKVVFLSPANKYLNLTSPISALKFYLRFIKQSYKEKNSDFKRKMLLTRSEMEPYRKNIAASAQVAAKRILPNISIHTFNVFRKLVTMANNAVDIKDVLETPALLLWGKLDELVPQASVQYIEKHFTNCTTELIEDLGHAMLMTNKDNILIKKVVNFLSDGEIEVDIPVREIL